MIDWMLWSWSNRLTSCAVKLASSIEQADTALKLLLAPSGCPAG